MGDLAPQLLYAGAAALVAFVAVGALALLDPARLAEGAEAPRARD